MTDTISIIETNYDLVAALALCHNVDIEVVAEYEDLLEIDAIGEAEGLGEFVSAVNTL